ncbi:hypothetical protein Tco_1046064 [Tanacetum coccineum]
MQNGSRNTKCAFTLETNGHERNQSSNPPRVFRTDCHDRRKPIRKRKNGTLQSAQEQIEYFLEILADMTRRSKKLIEKSNLLTVTLFKSFLDDYKGYHQIRWRRKTRKKKKTSLPHLAREFFLLYTKMTFGLKIDWAITTGHGNKAFEKIDQRKLEVYVMELVIKSYTKDEILDIERKNILTYVDTGSREKGRSKHEEAVLAEMPSLNKYYHFNGKTGLSTSTCYKKAEEILPGTPGMTNYRYWLLIASSGWFFVSAISSQMTHLVASITLDSARSRMMQAVVSVAVMVIIMLR